MRLFFLFLLATSSLFGKVYDTFIFFNEVELLKIRLEELDPVVDYFVLVEGTLTFSGQPKPLYFEENKALFEPYLDKIIHIVVDDYPPPLRDPVRSAWNREHHQRNAILRGLHNASPDDLVFVSDVDEIPRATTIERVRKDKKQTLKLEMPVYRYQLNRLDYKGWTFSYGTLCKILRHQSPQKLRMLKSLPVLADAGWHFTSMGGSESVLYKLNSFSHFSDGNTLDLIQGLRKDFAASVENMRVVPITSNFPKRVLRLADAYREDGWIAPLNAARN